MMRFVPILAVINIALGIFSGYLAIKAITFYSGVSGDVIGTIVGLNRQTLFFWDFIISILALITGIYFCFRSTHQSRYYGPLMLTLCGIACIFFSYAIFDYKVAWIRSGWELKLFDMVSLFVFMVGVLNLIFAVAAWRRTFFTAVPSLPDDPEC